MTGLVRKATLLSVCGLLAAGAAFASVPDPTQSTCPAHINVVGSDGSVADVAGDFTVTVRDLAGALIPGSIVVVDFSACNDILFCTNQLAGGTTQDCPTMTVRKATNGSGVAAFSIIGGADVVAGGPTGSPLGSVKIYADGVLLCSLDTGAFDLDDAGGVGGADLSLWLDDFGLGGNPPRADYDGDATVGGADLSLWLDVFGNGLSGVSCTSTECGP